MAGSEKPPRWDLAPVYADCKAPNYLAAKLRVAELAEGMVRLCASPAGKIGDWLSAALAIEDEAVSLQLTLSSYAYARYSTATRDEASMAELNSIEELALPLKRSAVLFRNALAARREEVLAAARGKDADPRVSPFAFHLEEELFLQSKQMSPELEDLAADLLRSGGDAWGRLQEAVTSNTSVLWEPRTGERKTIVELRNLAYDADRSIREKAWRLELDAWKGVEIPVAAALNGVKGFASTLNKRRSWESAIDRTIEQSRITRKTLDALIGAMEDSLPVFRRYLAAKARLFGLPKLAFFDLFGPVAVAGADQRKYDWAATKAFIVAKFSSFDPAMGRFAERAFDESWIDAEPREGKVGGAYCTHFPAAKVARILCNFDGTFSDVNTIAHELGHAWHYDCIKDKPVVLADYPMTLAETASIFAETLVFESAIAETPAQERLGLLEMHLQDSCQVIVDILSRYWFEASVFEKRKEGELSADEFSSLMVAAQRRSYGEGLDPDKLHQYMWAAKGHYYSPDLSFYNFPYAFGLLFGLGLLARYREEGPGFAASYRDLLAQTGSASAVAVTKMAGFDIETKAFWKSGLDVIAAQVAEFEKLVAGCAAKA